MLLSHHARACSMHFRAHRIVTRETWGLSTSVPVNLAREARQLPIARSSESAAACNFQCGRLHPKLSDSIRKPHERGVALPDIYGGTCKCSPSDCEALEKVIVGRFILAAVVFASYLEAQWGGHTHMDQRAEMMAAAGTIICADLGKNAECQHARYLTPEEARSLDSGSAVHATDMFRSQTEGIVVPLGSMPSRRILKTGSLPSGVIAERMGDMLSFHYLSAGRRMKIVSSVLVHEALKTVAEQRGKRASTGDSITGMWQSLGRRRRLLTLFVASDRCCLCFQTPPPNQQHSAATISS
ncbi:hypothetical protein BDY19DRAFT_907541 [Irpex rosettiformis]|uniref:Uncharacterized protein n=1 Tax=Irpex rosettiformis TaxID=378272 RepID=A0ACB8TZB5_9APHY|nr:hypothetical protein BDY19DRAFT_907541 [Irpex rosettiformis]